MTDATLSTYALPMQRDVALFHDAFGMPNAISAPRPLPLDRIELRISLIREEGLAELGDAIKQNNQIEIIDALIDTVYVSLGALVEMGANIDATILARNDTAHASPSLSLADSGTNSLEVTNMYVVMLEDAFRAQHLMPAVNLLSLITGAALRALIHAGIDAQPFFDEVQRANMSKLGADGKPVYSRGEDLDGYPAGKVLKGANYSPPDLASVYARLT